MKFISYIQTDKKRIIIIVVTKSIPAYVHKIFALYIPISSPETIPTIPILVYPCLSRHIPHGFWLTNMGTRHHGRHGYHGWLIPRTIRTIRTIRTPRLSEVPLKFQPREGRGHLPKPPKAWLHQPELGTGKITNKWEPYIKYIYIYICPTWCSKWFNMDEFCWEREDLQNISVLRSKSVGSRKRIPFNQGDNGQSHCSSIAADEFNVPK